MYYAAHPELRHSVNWGGGVLFIAGASLVDNRCKKFERKSCSVMAVIARC